MVKKNRRLTRKQIRKCGRRNSPNLYGSNNPLKSIWGYCATYGVKSRP